MFPNLSPHAVGIVGLDLRGLIDLATRHSFAGIDLPLDDFDDGDDARLGADMVREAGLQWGGFGLPVAFRGTEAEYSNSMEQLRRLVRVADAAGCRRCTTWLMPCHDELDYEANYALHVRRLQPVAAVLAESRIRFGIEFVGPRTLRQTRKYAFVHTIDQCLKLCDAIGHDCGVLLDSFHWFTSHADEQDITAKLCGRVIYAHVNDAIHGRGRDGQLDNERAMPCDTGMIDLSGFVRALRATAYDGPVSVEPFMPDLRQRDADDLAAKVSESLRRLLALG